MEQPSHSPRQMVRIDVLPDDLLLETFDFYVNMHPPLFGKEKIEAWQTLVHVCRRWRILVLGSPRRLNLQLCCTPKTPTRHALNIWPALPLVICGNLELLSNTDSVIAALGQSNRVRRVFLWVFASRQLEGILAAMQVPFPELTDLRLLSNGDSETMPIIDSLLGGSGPRLQHFSLNGIPFPGLPRLLFSATDLVTLWLFDIPHSGYISPEAIVALLSVLSSLDRLILEFESPQSRPDRESRRFPPSNHSVIPALSSLSFKGAIEYLEEFVTGIDTPQLEGMLITLFNQIDFDTPRLAQFINRTPKLRKTNAHVRLVDDFARVTLRVPTEYKFLEIRVSCREPDWQLSSIEQLCNSSFPPLSTVEVLYIGHEYSKLVWKNDTIENTLWLQLLLPFTAVKNLYLSKDFAPEIASALQELVGSRTTEVLPNLQNILVEGLEPLGHFQENIGQFVSARQLSDHPIALSVWDKSSDMEWV